MVTSEQIRAARALLRLEQGELAKRAHVSAATLRRLEAPGGTARVDSRTVDGVRRVLEDAGAEFIDRGVRQRPERPDADAIMRAITEAQDRIAALPVLDPNFSEADLYDENGLPR